MKDLGIGALVGRTVLGSSINEDRDLMVLSTDKGNLYITWEGDCCAKCFLANVSGSEYLEGSTILEAENAEWKDVSRSEEDYEVLESMGTKIKTSSGYVTMESRVSHNGHYGGSIMVSDVGPMDQYHSRRGIDNTTLVPLTDF